ncbi:MAG TPA: tetratricopeptide repeat protein, partial [Pyrinomonadaceae bacterium]
MLIPNDDLQQIDRLQEENLNLRAYELAKAFGPFSDWEGTDALLLASHLTYSLGAPEQSARLTSRAWHRDKTNPRAIFYYAIELLQKRGPLPALLFMRKFPDFESSDKMMSWWFSLYGQLYSSLRDFAVADSWHEKAIAVCPGESWVWVSRAFSFEQQDQYDEALSSARKGFEAAPHRRATVSALAHYLTLHEANEEALELLSTSIEKVENAWLVKHLADIQTEMGLHAEAYSTLQRCFELLPLLEPKTGEWFYGGLSDSAYLVGDLNRAEEYAGKASNPFHAKILENLKSAPEGAKRVVLDVRFLRQHHVTCAPATISNIARYWKKKAEHLDLVEQMCYDGTPSYKERIWAESNDWLTKEFTLNWDDSRALLDRGVPLTLATVYPGGGHLQAIIGYDERRRSYLIRDPYYARTGEFLADELLEDQKASGPRVMALVPAGSEDLLAGLNRELLEAEIYDLSYEVESALEFHKRENAAAALARLEEKYPDHRLTLVAKWALSSYDTNTLGVRSALRQLLKQFPEDVNLRLNDVSISSDTTGRIERLETLERYSRSKPTDPIIWQMFGYELGLDAKQHRRALHWLFKSIRKAPANGLTYRLIADILWSQRRFEDAAKLSRIALSLNDKDEQFAYSYFLAMRYLKREDEALELLRDRYARFGRRSGLPACSLFSALQELSRIEEAFAVLDEAIDLRPEDGDLILYAADAKARFGRTAEAEALLEAARNKTARSKRLRTAARVAQIKGDLETALANWRKVLEDDPTATDAHENIATLIKGLESSSAAKDHLRRVCRKFPSNRTLHVLRLQHLNEEPAEAIAVLRDLIRLDPGDVWSLRELSNWYAQVGKFDRALEA